MGDAFRKVRTGDPLHIPAAAYNAFVDAAIDVRQRQQDQRRPPSPLAIGHCSGVVLVKNASSEDLPRFGAVGLDSAIIAPADNLAAFQERVALTAVTPVVPDHLYRWGVLHQPLPSGGIGLATIAGVIQVQIDVGDVNHHTAGPINGDATKLKSGLPGCDILYSPPGATGLQWCVVRLGRDRSVQARITATGSDADAGKHSAEQVICSADGSPQTVTDGLTWAISGEGATPLWERNKQPAQVDQVVLARLEADAAGAARWVFDLGGGGLPEGGVKYQVLCVLNDDGDKGWDWVRAH